MTDCTTMGEQGRLMARRALLEAAKEARTRGDIGKEGCVEVWDWLEYWANRNYPMEGGVNE